jgi:hypothetical protein
MTVSKLVNKLAKDIVFKTRENKKRRTQLQTLRNSILQYVFGHDDYDYNEIDCVNQVAEFFDEYTKRFSELSSDGKLQIAIYSKDTGEIYTKLDVEYTAREDAVLCNMLEHLIINNEIDGYDF